MKELWKPIINFEDRYLISNHGRVKSLYLNRILKPVRHKVGYMQIGLYNGEKQMFKLVHRLVAIHFIDNPDNKSDVNHKDLNKQNNYDWNLEWTTHLENMQHAKKLGFRYASRI